MNKRFEPLKALAQRFPKRFVIICIVFAIGLSLLSVNLLLHQSARPAQNAAPLPTAGPNQSARILQENARPGSKNWLIPQGKAATTQIQVYANKLSVRPGQAITFYVSVQKDRTPYAVDIYRLGWYRGDGGRLLASLKETGKAQGYYDAAQGKLVGCHSCTHDKSTDLVEANWQPSFSYTVPASFLTGVYLAKFTDAYDGQVAVPFDVTGDPTSTYVAVTSDTTVAAYNQWGGYSLYLGPDGTVNTRSRAVSFNRPVAGQGAEQGLLYEIDAIRWMEREGYDVSYISSVDVQEDPGQLLRHRAYISLGHDEYWSKEMRDGVEAARDAGVNLAFLGANAVYWQIRFAADKAGNPDRTVICYKDARLDPLFHKDNARVTVEWRDPPVNRPENALVGIMYSSHVHQPTGFPWKVSASPLPPLFQGTGLQPGKQYGCDLVGYEWDRVFDNGATPPGLQVLSASAVVDIQHLADTSNTAYYVAASGAFVFASGSIQWSFALDGLRLLPNPACAKATAPIAGIQRLMTIVMQQLGMQHHQGTA